MRFDAQETHVYSIIKRRFSLQMISDYQSDEREFFSVEQKNLRLLLNFLKNDSDTKLKNLVDILVLETRQDQKQSNFTLHYLLRSYSYPYEAVIVLPLASNGFFLSVADLFPSANWLEREIWDSYGLIPEGHPKLKRILLYKGFSGHPMQKAYPVSKAQPLIKMPFTSVTETNDDE